MGSVVAVFMKNWRLSPLGVPSEPLLPCSSVLLLPSCPSSGLPLARAPASPRKLCLLLEAGAVPGVFGRDGDIFLHGIHVSPSVLH